MNSRLKVMTLPAGALANTMLVTLAFKVTLKPVGAARSRVSTPEAMAGVARVSQGTADSLLSSADCSPATVLMAWLPVWFARLFRLASVSLAVAPMATPFSLVLSAELMKPATAVVASECAPPPAPTCALICACSLPRADSTESAAVIAAFVARLRPVSTTSRTRAAVWYRLLDPSGRSSVSSLAVAPAATPSSFDFSASPKALVSGLDS
ncbi:hypothetical protein D9M69_427110 [compost metagenome]